MPFKSRAQEKWMYATHPKMARQWQKETPKGKLPEKVKDKKMANKEQKGNANQKKEPKMTLKEKRAAKQAKKDK